MAGGGHVIIRNKIAETGGLGSVKDQLGPLKLAKLEAILAKAAGDWAPGEGTFVLKCIREALEAYE